MFTKRLRRGKLTRPQTKELVLMMATRTGFNYIPGMYGTPNPEGLISVPMDETPTLTTEDDVRSFLALATEGRGTLEDFVEHVRGEWPERAMPFFHNVIGSTWVIGDTEIVTSSYQSRFESAVEHLDRAVSETSFEEALSALSKGISSVEGFISRMAEIWNEAHLSDQLIDSATSRVRFDAKIDEWVPKMTGGVRVDKSGKTWNAFVRMKALPGFVWVGFRKSGLRSGNEGRRLRPCATEISTRPFSASGLPGRWWMSFSTMCNSEWRFGSL